MDKDKDKALMIRAHNGDEKSIEAIIEQYTPMIHHIITRKHYWHNDNDNDLVNDGMLGIMMAISTYDEAKNGVVSTWMYCHIRKQLQLGKRAEFNVQTPHASDHRIFADEYLEDRKVPESYKSHHSHHSPTDNAEMEDKIKLVSEILIWLNKRFPKHYAEIFYKYFFEDLTLKELDEEYDLQAKQVIYQIKIAIKKKFNKKGKIKI